MIAYTPTSDVNHIVNVLTECAKACRSLTNPAVRSFSFSRIPKFVQLLNDCAATCDLAVILIERKSHIIFDFLEVCEELSLECAWECSNYGYEICEQCARACERVAKACLPYILEKDMVGKDTVGA